MAITNSERVGKALDLLKDGLRPYVERELKATYKDRWIETAGPSFPDWQHTGKEGKGLNWDTQALLQVMCELWNDCFKKILGPSERSLAFELRDVRNRWAHQKTFSTDDAYRAIDSVSRLLAAVSDLEDPRPFGTEPGVRTSRRAEPVGPPEDLLDGRRLPRHRQRFAIAGGGFGGAGGGRRADEGRGAARQG